MVLKNPFYRKSDLLQMVGLEASSRNYYRFRKLLSEDIAACTRYDKKHTFTENEKNLIVSWFRKQS